MKVVYPLTIIFLIAIGGLRAQSDSTHVAEQIIDPVETLPKFIIDGLDLMEYIQQQTVIWKAELQNQINGKLFLQFTVTPMAEIKNIATLKKIGSIPEKTERRAQQLLEKIKASGPATLQGRPIEIRMVVLFKF